MIRQTCEMAYSRCRRLRTRRRAARDSSGTRASRNLVINVFLTEDTESLRVALHYPFGDRTVPPRPELFKHGGLANYSTEISVPLAGLNPGKYRVVVRPCGKEKGASGKAPPEEFAFDLPDATAHQP
jgi:hypothetical protein